ncbi:MAG TPA: hypothetical protein PLX90_12045, partial [Anaerolineales bacterium]|nr:hypothetical protein [Anaerolineales bacterium]
MAQKPEVLGFFLLINTVESLLSFIMMSFLEQFFDPSLSEKPLGFRRNIRLVLMTGLICTCILVVVNINREEMAWLAGLFLVALILNQFGYYLIANWLTLF